MIVKKKIVIGTYAVMLSLDERKKYNDSTHEWTCILRANEPTDDLSTFISKATFYLHSSFSNNERTFKNTPNMYFTEYGWGEFEIVCKIQFIDPKEKAIELRHYLKLYSDNTIDISTIVPPAKKSYDDNIVINETYDELIFKSPSNIIVEGVSQSYIKKTQPHYLERFFRKNTVQRENEYIQLQLLIQNDIRKEQEKIKKQLVMKNKFILNLLNIYYTLRPDKALSLLCLNPQLLNLCAGDELTKEQTKKLNDEARTFSKNINNSAYDSGFITKEQLEQCLTIFDQLIKKGLISPKSGTALATMLQNEGYFSDCE